MVRFLAAIAAAGVVAGCATSPAPTRVGTDDLEAQCEAYFVALDRIVEDARVGDAEATRVPGFAYLRTDRFLASFRLEVADDALRPWTDAMLRLDREARAVELRNLPRERRDGVRTAAALAGLMDADPDVHVHGCGKLLRERDLATAESRHRLRAAAAVPDDYETWKRIAGVYALTRVPFAMGVRSYEQEVLGVYATPLDALPVRGRLVRYEPEVAERIPPEGVIESVRRIVRAGAAFEVPDPSDVRRLLALHAPVFEIDEALPEDRIGIVRRDADGAPIVDTARAVIYGRVAFTRLEGRVLPQAVYTAWLPGRPKTSPFDLLGGAWDAIVWRATLDEDGAPLAFDTMHACGCYHMFFPTPRLELRPRPDSLDEWALVPQRLPELAPGQLVRVRVASRSHYVERVIVGDAPAQRRYGIEPEGRLRNLPAADGAARSLYGPDGIVPGSERGERYIFWPMGVREPGAMRQWGRHATAFVGRRHFDDADLLSRYFVLR